MVGDDKVEEDVVELLDSVDETEDEPEEEGEGIVGGGVGGTSWG